MVVVTDTNVAAVSDSAARHGEASERYARRCITASANPSLVHRMIFTSRGREILPGTASLAIGEKHNVAQSLVRCIFTLDVVHHR